MAAMMSPLGEHVLPLLSWYAVLRAKATLAKALCIPRPRQRRKTAQPLEQEIPAPLTPSCGTVALPLAARPKAGRGHPSRKGGGNPDAPRTRKEERKGER